MWEVMFWPIMACVLLPWLLVYLGLHVVQRGIIFIDIAMAQMASLGICLAVLLHLDLESWTTFGIALAFTLVGAAIFSVTGKRASQIPQEAVIGISYVVAAAAAVLLLSRAAEGDEEIKHMLIGWIVALVGGVAGLFLSYWWDLPSGAAIVCTFGALLIAVASYALIRARLRPR